MENNTNTKKKYSMLTAKTFLAIVIFTEKHKINHFSLTAFNILI